MAKRSHHGAASGSFSAAFGDIEDFINSKLEDFDRLAHDAIQEAGEVGHQTMLDIIESTSSDTGRKRAGNGGHSGRVDSGNMLDAVSSDNLTKGSGDDKSYITTWGWLHDLEQYFLLQDDWDGVSKDGAMKAIHQSYIAGREKLFEELSK